MVLFSAVKFTIGNKNMNFLLIPKSQMVKKINNKTKTTTTTIGPGSLKDLFQ